MGEEMVGQRPCGVLTVDEPSGCRLGRQMLHEHAQPAGRECPGEQSVQRQPVEPLEVSFDGLPVLD